MNLGAAALGELVLGSIEAERPPSSDMVLLVIQEWPESDLGAKGGVFAWAWPGTPQQLPAGSVNRGFPVAPLAEHHPASSLRDAASQAWVRRIVDTVNNAVRGKMNVTLSVSLAANRATTTITDVRIGAFSALLFTPLTAAAAVEMAAGTLFVSAQKSGEATVSHANNTISDRTFRVVILA